jgi:glyoxylase-like metal-dependent hydrolase (beta-lactamase superfamily II)
MIQIQLANPIKILVKQAGNVRIHTFISSYEDDNIANATHIVESKNVLVLIDGQFLTPYAKQFREYADSLEKPIERIYLSHRHPDHWFGLGAAFSDCADVMYALPETIDFIRENGEQSRQDHAAKMGDNLPDQIVVPENVAKPGIEVIDGIDYVFERVIDTEIDFLLTIRLPQLGVHIVQDLIYSGTHLYLTNDIEHWISILENMLTSTDELFLPGHGLPADKNEVARNVEYLAAANQAIANGLKDDDFKNFLIQRYPERKCPGIFDIYIPRLFDGAGQF